MTEESKYDNRQTVLLFIAGVAMCATFFVFGLWIGRWSVTRSEQGLLGGAPTIGQPAGAKPAESSPPSLGQPPRGTTLAATGESAGATDRSGGTSNPAESSTSDRPSPNELPTEPKAYVVRAANFARSDDAETFAATLRNRGFTTAHTKTDNGGPKTYLVVLGPYANRADAVGAAADLRNNGVSNVQVIPER